MHGADVPFTTTNYNITTCPRAEYDIVVGECECPLEQRKDLEGRLVRRLRPVAELQRERMSVEAGLGREEIVAVVRRRDAAPPRARCPPLSVGARLEQSGKRVAGWLA